MDKEKRDRLVDLIEQTNLHGSLGFLYISLISSDSNLAPDDCDANIKNLESLLEVIDETNLKDDEKAKWKEKFKSGIEILMRDKNEMTKDK